MFTTFTILQMFTLTVTELRMLGPHENDSGSEKYCWKNAIFN